MGRANALSLLAKRPRRRAVNLTPPVCERKRPPRRTGEASDSFDACPLDRSRDDNDVSD